MNYYCTNYINQSSLRNDLCSVVASSSSSTTLLQPSCMCHHAPSIVLRLPEPADFSITRFCWTQACAAVVWLCAWLLIWTRFFRPVYARSLVCELSFVTTKQNRTFQRRHGIFASLVATCTWVLCHVRSDSQHKIKAGCWNAIKVILLGTVTAVCYLVRTDRQHRAGITYLSKGRWCSQTPSYVRSFRRRCRCGCVSLAILHEASPPCAPLPTSVLRCVTARMHTWNTCYQLTNTALILMRCIMITAAPA